MRREVSSTTITSISTPGARNVSWRAVSSLRTPVSSAAESNTSSASSSSIVRHVQAARAPASTRSGTGSAARSARPTSASMSSSDTVMTVLLSGRSRAAGASSGARGSGPWWVRCCRWGGRASRRSSGSRGAGRRTAGASAAGRRRDSLAKACSTARSVTSSETRSSTDGDVSSGSSSSAACGVRRLLPRITRSASLRVVVASHDASRSGWRIRLQCSARRSHTVCTTSSVAADDSRYERATDHTRPAKRSTTSSQARSSPAMTRVKQLLRLHAGGAYAPDRRRGHAGAHVTRVGPAAR